MSMIRIVYPRKKPVRVTKLLTGSCAVWRQEGRICRRKLFLTFNPCRMKSRTFQVSRCLRKKTKVFLNS